MGSAIAFRLFLFFVPLLLLVVGIAGFASDLVTARQSAGMLVSTAASGRRSARLFTSLGSHGGLRCCSACSGW